MPLVTTMQRPINRVRFTAGGGGDVTAPTLTTATINLAGTSLTLAFSEPVTFGAGGNTGFTVSLTGGSATLTYSSGSGTSLLVYNISRTVSSSETGTTSYTQPGNGIEDAAGNDLATFSGETITNNSSQSGSEDWQLPAGNFVSAKMVLTDARVVHPRPDSETSSTAFHRNAYPNMQYEIPIGIQGGAYPYYFEIITAPSGTTLGSTIFEADYGILKWTPTVAGGPHTFQIRVTDQDLAEVTITWTVTVSTSWLIFVSTSGNDTTGSGTLASPYATISKAVSVATGGKGICIRSGSYSAGTNQNVFSSTTFRSIFGYPGETVNVSCASIANSGNSGAFYWSTGGDYWASNMRVHNSSTLQTNSRFFTSQTNAVNRCYQYDIHFDTGASGTTGNDNCACMFIGSSTGGSTYAMQSHCKFERLPPTAGVNGYAAFDIYGVQYFLHEENTYDVPSSSADEVLWIKGAHNYDQTIRRNRFSEPWAGYLFYMNLGVSSGGAPQRIEVCYNKILSSTNASITSGSVPYATFRVGVNQNGGDSSTTRGPVWLYRNTLQGCVIIHEYPSSQYPLNFSSESDTIVDNVKAPGKNYRIIGRNGDGTSILDPAGRPLVTFSATNIETHATVATGVLDGSYNLTGSYRTNYLGTRGHAISNGVDVVE
jgi:hypothetical protein